MCALSSFVQQAVAAQPIEVVYTDTPCHFTGGAEQLARGLSCKLVDGQAPLAVLLNGCGTTRPDVLACPRRCTSTLLQDKSAYAQTVFGLCAGPGQPVHTFDGRTAGVIVPARGPLDFGWDPVFEPSEGAGGKTYAEMEKDEKNAISHRGKALDQLRTWLVQNADAFADECASASAAAGQ